MTFHAMTSEILMTDEQLKAVGCLTVESANLEYLLDEFIQYICRFTDEQKELFIGKWTIGTKIEAIKVLVRPKLRSNNKVKEFDALFKKMTDLNTRRNIITHGVWTTSQPYNSFAILATGSGRRSDAIAVSNKKKLPIKAVDVMTVALRIHECYYELLDLHRGLVVKRLRTSLNKSPEQSHK